MHVRRGRWLAPPLITLIGHDAPTHHAFAVDDY